MNRARARIRAGRPIFRMILVAGLLPAVADAQGPSSGEVRDLRGRIEANLRSEMTAGCLPRAVGRDPDGFHQTFAGDWSPLPDSNRSLVYQSRVTWTAAAFALHSPDRRDEYLGYARRGVEYLDRVMRDREGDGFFWSLGPDGKLAAGDGGEKHVYGTAFALYAASKAREATHDDLALKVARDAFDWLERQAHDPVHGGYFEALTRDGRPILAWDADAPIARRVDRLGVYYGFKTMNSHIHLLEALAEFYRVEKTPIVKERLAETLAIVRDRIAAEPGALNLYLSRDWKPAPAHDSFGHDIETAYLLVEATEVLGLPDDPKTWRVARSLVDHALDWGWDEAHGGFHDKGDVFAGRAHDTTKVWWTQAEGLNALLVMHHKYGDKSPRYWRAFRKQWDFIERHMIDPAHGGWYWETTAEGTPGGEPRKATEWKANYHTGRALMNVSTLLGEMIEKAE